MNADLKSKIDLLDAEHAKLWRAITMSSEWRRLQLVEAQLEMLNELVETAPESTATDELKNGK